MTLDEALDLLRYWRREPPLHEVVGILARAHTTWNPEEQIWAEMPEEERRAAHAADLERRWKAGAAMSAEQMWKATGGVTSDGTMPGIGPFPGSPAAKRAAEAAQLRAQGGK